MPPILEVRGLSFRYPSYPGLASAQLLDRVDLTVREGQCLRILGRPETGKSTLARVLCGLVPRYSGGELGGEIRLGELDLRSARACDIIERVGIVFQNPDEQIVTTCCRAEVAFSLESLGIDPEEIRGRTLAALSWAGLEDYGDRNPSTLSGGEKRRLLVACLHAVRPALWILDETVEELDAQFRATLMRHLRGSGASAVLFASKELPLGDLVDATYRIEEGGLREAAAAQGVPSLRPSDLPPMRRAATGAVVLAARGIEYAFDAAGQGFRLSVPELDLSEREIVALAGPNGAGKTTLARILCGLIRPRSGEVLVGGPEGLAPAGSDALRSLVAYVFQNPDYQLFLPTVGEELAYGHDRPRVPADEIARRVREAIERFGLPGPDAPMALLSYGARKRLQMAVYYLLRRKIVILDEADAGLPREDFADAVSAFSEQGATVLFISHDAELASGLAHRVVAMERGAIPC